jgi:hypothetical protein
MSSPKSRANRKRSDKFSPNTMNIKNKFRSSNYSRTAEVSANIHQITTEPLDEPISRTQTPVQM